ncbi:MAG: outer-membrane lipoprotein carrier protein LolA [Prevotellaceae bacterium]|nr:outer-membrane lipoprotein carrier protein LolA [Candidatus Minthosoma caballi]
MKNFIKYAFTLMLLVSASFAYAQDATKILDKTSTALKSAGNLKIGFTLNADGNSGTGYIKLQGQKFVVNMAGTITWFDGTTMWNYVKKNEEVNVTTPSAAEIAKMNPYSFLSFYKKGYTAKMGKSTAKEYEVILTGQANNPYSKVVMRVNKNSYQPSYIQMTSSKGNVTTINCNSFLKNQKYTEATFKFNKKNYPNVEVVDLR